MGITAGVLSGLLSAVGGIAGGVAKSAHGGPPSPLAQRAAGAAPYTPTTAGFGSTAGSAPQAADLRLSDILGQQRQQPDDEMTLRMIMGM
jgi:hypothetical protein